MAFLPKELSHPLKDRCEPLLLPGLANQHTAAGEIVRNHLVHAFPRKEARRDERDIIKPGVSERSRRPADRVGK